MSKIHVMTNRRLTTQGQRIVPVEQLKRTIKSLHSPIHKVVFLKTLRERDFFGSYSVVRYKLY